MVLSGCVSPTLQLEEVQELLVAFLLPALLSETGGLRAISSRRRPAASCRQKEGGKTHQGLFVHENA